MTQGITDADTDLLIALRDHPAMDNGPGFVDLVHRIIDCAEMTENQIVQGMASALQMTGSLEVPKAELMLACIKVGYAMGFAAGYLVRQGQGVADAVNGIGEEGEDS